MAAEPFGNIGKREFSTKLALARFWATFGRNKQSEKAALGNGQFGNVLYGEQLFLSAQLWGQEAHRIAIDIGKPGFCWLYSEFLCGLRSRKAES